jgi:MULE transposase domain
MPIYVFWTRTPLQVLIDLATKKDYLTKFNLGDTGKLTLAFFCHPDGANLALKFQSVLVLDCTYKRNWYKMPLLHFVGCNAFSSTFTIGYAFLSKEEIVDYIWAMNALCECVFGYKPKLFVNDRERALISAIYPSGHIFICTWHINKNVLLYRKKL